MIASISGKLTHKSPEFLIIDVNGIGYRIIVPLTTYYKLPEINNSVSLYTYTHIREDAFLLFGFQTREEKEIFEKLIGVSQIGPKLAANILSGITAKELKEAIAKGDIVKLTSIPGIGKKTAERIALELKDKIEFIIEDSQQSAVSRQLSVRRDPLFEDAVSALVNLGYKKGIAEDAAKQARGRQGEKTDIEGLIKESLKILSKA
ncbi:MAG: Holliday junction branch migration protein RuvA [Nitrospinota bacterium]